MEREIPDLSLPILYPLVGREKINGEIYIKKIEEFEVKCEKSLVETLSRLSINATVKRDRYSLPFKHEIYHVLYGESYLNGPYEFHRVAREFVKELLQKNLYKIRFYILIDVEKTGEGFLRSMGKITYRLRYYPH